LTDGYSSLTHDGYVKEEVPFPFEKRRYLIGLRGQVIKSIQGNTRAQITMPEGKNFVVVNGTPASIAAAKKAINKILNPPPAQPEYREDVDPNDPIAGDDFYEGPTEEGEGKGVTEEI